MHSSDKNKLVMPHSVYWNFKVSFAA